MCEGQRQGERERTPSRLRAASAEPDVGLEAMKPELKLRVRRLTDRATQAPQDTAFFTLKCRGLATRNSFSQVFMGCVWQSLRSVVCEMSRSSRLGDQRPGDMCRNERSLCADHSDECWGAFRDKL